MELIDMMGVLTTIVTLGMFMTGLPPCLEMYRSKNTKNIPFLMFVVSLLSCGQMLHYSLMLDEFNLTLVLVNVVGFFMQIVYVTMYVAVVPDKTQSLVYLGVTFTYNTALYYYLYHVIGSQPEMAQALGGAASTLTTLIMCLPIMEIVQNIRHQNADGMPMIMLLGGVACGSCWLVYGLMLGDPNVYFPNIPGLAISLVKISVVQMYKDKPKTD